MLKLLNHKITKLRVKNDIIFKVYSIKHAAKKSSKYTSTINIPKTNFPNHLTVTQRQSLEANLISVSLH